MKSKVKKVLSIILNVILWVIILLAALFAFTTLATKDPNNVSSFLGYTPLSVMTDSMSPTFNSGDLIIIKKCDPNDVNVGDIITYHTVIENKYTLNTHRVVEIDDSSPVKIYTTKGDNNPVPDTDPIVNADIVGKYVTHIPGMGNVMTFLQSSLGFLLCILLPMLAFFIYQVYNLVIVANKFKKAAAIEEAEEKARIQAEANAAAGVPTHDEETERLKAELEEAKRKLAEAQGKAEAPADNKPTDAAPAEGQKSEAPAESKPADAVAAGDAVKEKIQETVEAAKEVAKEVKEEIQEATKEINETKETKATKATKEATTETPAKEESETK